MQLLWVILVCQFACWVFRFSLLAESFGSLSSFLSLFSKGFELFNPSYHESFEILALLDPDIRQESCASISVIVAYIYVTKSLMHHTRFPFFTIHDCNCKASLFASLPRLPWVVTLSCLTFASTCGSEKRVATTWLARISCYGIMSTWCMGPTLILDEVLACQSCDMGLVWRNSQELF